jgi:hypothetical protein
MIAYKIDKSQFVGKKPVGIIFEGKRDYSYKNLVEVYISGEVPVLIQTNMTKFEFKKFCDGKLTKQDIESLKTRGII